MNKKKKSNKSGYPDEAIKTLARCFYPSMVEFFNSEEGQREYEEWLKEQEALKPCLLQHKNSRTLPVRERPALYGCISPRCVQLGTPLIFLPLIF